MSKGHGGKRPGAGRPRTYGVTQPGIHRTASIIDAISEREVKLLNMVISGDATALDQLIDLLSQRVK